MKRAGIIIGIILIGAAYVLGFWPQYQKRKSSQRQLELANVQVANLQSRIQLYQLQHDLLGVIRQTEQKNYGQASALSTKFFDAIRIDLPRQTQPKVKTALQSILQQRDAVTSALAKADPSALGLLQPLENKMFQVLSEPAGPGSAETGSQL